MTRLRSMALLAVSLVMGCAARPAAVTTDSQGRPITPSFALSLKMQTQDGRATLFELARDGQLSFGGGRDAILGITRPALKLSPAQLTDLWGIIQQHRLLQARSALAFAKARHAIFRLTIRPQGQWSHQVRSLDQQHPGVAELHEALFRLQAAASYHTPQIGAEQRDPPRPTLQRIGP